MKILDDNQIRAADRVTIQSKNISSLVLMEHAAGQCFNWIIAHINISHTIHVFCGKGNNGGDGLVIARKLCEYGYKNIQVYLIHFKQEGSPEFKANLKRLIDLELLIRDINSEDDHFDLKPNDLVIDAIFGTGLQRPVQGLARYVIQSINEAHAKVVAVDLPSGLFCSKHNQIADSIIQAEHSLTFQVPKLCMFLPQNKNHSKNWHILDIGLDQDFIDEIHSQYFMTDLNLVKKIYRKREKFSHKGNFGHSLIIGGSYGKMGAVHLSAKASLKIGSGLTTVLAPQCGYDILQTNLPEAMLETDDYERVIRFKCQVNPDVIGIGMGLGTATDTAKGMINFIAQNSKQLVLDADALNILSQHKEVCSKLPNDTVLTPHPKEFERLVGPWTDDYHKLEKAKELTLKFSIILVLKGYHTMVVYKGMVYFNTTGNAGLATAGSGDVLTGYITGLIAQQYQPLQACILGVYLHGLSADLGVQSKESEESFMASDNFKYIGLAIKKLI